jgi:Ran GTPase-activating protein (RanGAP) involved in mRNA processing and transport
MNADFRERVRSAGSVLVLAGQGIDVKRCLEIVQALNDNINPSLTSLRLDGNPVGISGAGALATMLKSNKTLLTLDLGDCRLGDNGVELLCEALVKNSTLTKLYLHSNGIGDEGIRARLSATLSPL